MIRSLLKNRKALILSIISMSLPAIGEMALNTMLGVSDTIMISRMVGTEALAAVGFANQIVFVLIFVFSSFNTGAVALISRSLGEKNYAKLRKIAQQNVILNLLIALVILGFAIPFAPNVLRIFKTAPSIYLDSLVYFRILLIGFVPMFLSFAFAAILRGAGNTITPMVVTGIANGINIIGNYLLIKGIGPFPSLGIAGAAWATSGSRILALGIYIYVLYIKPSRRKLKFRILFDRKILKPLWQISLPGAIEQGLMQLSFLVVGIIISQLETASEAAFRVLIQIESMSFMPAVGISIASATLVGKALGERDPDKAIEIGYISSGMGVLWGILVGSVFLLFPEGILTLFSSDPELMGAALFAMIFLGLNQIGLNFNIVLTGALRGAGDTRRVMIITSCRLWLIFVPLSYLFVIIMRSGIPGIWYAEMISFAFFGTILFFRFKRKNWINQKTCIGSPDGDPEAIAV